MKNSIILEEISLNVIQYILFVQTTIPNIFLYSIYVKEGFEIFMLEVIVVITICLNHSITETIMLGISMAC